MLKIEEGAKPLSAAEKQIIGLTAQGMTNKQVAETLNMTVHVVRNHLRSILEKTGCASRYELASCYWKSELALS